MNQVTLYAYKDAEISVSVEARFDSENNLLIDGYDIGKKVSEWWGDSDYEYVTTIKAPAVEKLYTVPGIPPGDRAALLTHLAKSFNTNTCYSDLSTWLAQHGVPAEGWSWC